MCLNPSIFDICQRYCRSSDKQSHVFVDTVILIVPIIRILEARRLLYLTSEAEVCVSFHFVGGGHDFKISFYPTVNTSKETAGMELLKSL